MCATIFILYDQWHFKLFVAVLSESQHNSCNKHNAASLQKGGMDYIAESNSHCYLVWMYVLKMSLHSFNGLITSFIVLYYSKHKCNGTNHQAMGTSILPCYVRLLGKVHWCWVRIKNIVLCVWSHVRQKNVSEQLEEAEGVWVWPGSWSIRANQC